MMQKMRKPIATATIAVAARQHAVLFLDLYETMLFAAWSLYDIKAHTMAGIPKTLQQNTEQTEVTRVHVEKGSISVVYTTLVFCINC